MNPYATPKSPSSSQSVRRDFEVIVDGRQRVISFVQGVMWFLISCLWFRTHSSRIEGFLEKHWGDFFGFALSLMHLHGAGAKRPLPVWQFSRLPVVANGEARRAGYATLQRGNYKRPGNLVITNDELVFISFRRDFEIRYPLAAVSDSMDRYEDRRSLWFRDAQGDLVRMSSLDVNRWKVAIREIQRVPVTA